MVKLNLGAGERPLPGYENLDRKTGQEAYPLKDYADNSVDEIRASHVLEHFGHRQIGAVLSEWVRVLKPNGWLKVAVPDFEWVARKYLAREPDNFQAYIMGGQSDADDFHGTIFDKQVLSEALEVAGLRDVSRWQSDQEDCSSYECSLNLKGRKAGPIPKLNIGCAMSVPRLGFQNNFFCWANALMPFGIRPVKYDGAYWGQCLERTLTDLANEHDWILCLDYDSVFIRRHVVSMLYAIAENPECDAIAAVQIRRSGDTPLFTIRDAENKLVPALPVEAFEHPLIEVDTAHFGFTMLRSEALKRMPHPWFLGVPDESGQWGDGRTDDDIYFWKQWKKAGNKLHIANRVIVGHEQSMITWPAENGEVVHQASSDFWNDGLPQEVWQ